ncbi:hypothetical protein BDV95DRAFT_610230 [Massariosphaeria phaeospora]|uniref:GPI anchored protein n=1 Tax=Massariosphaeria phaeospora TaxID=100035 RepID=A0A7C8I1F4_9PLEO|nr:hypothetical protein BDV95DRAFT_610230 [Massariosphaeria phaeospora]
MHQSIAILSAFAGAAFAQTPTIQFFFPGGYEGVDPVVSVVEANPATTVLALGCPTGVDSTECGWSLAPFQYSIISQTSYHASASDLMEIAMDCTANVQATEMACVVTAAGPDGPETTSTVLSGSEVRYATATVTAGADLLDATGAPTSGSASSGKATSAASRSSAAAASQSTASGPSSTGAKSNGTASASGTGGPPESTGAAYRFGVEGSALLALAGAAVMNAW